MEVSCSVGYCLWKYGIFTFREWDIRLSCLSGIGLQWIGEHEGIGYVSAKDFDVKIDLGLQKHFWNSFTRETIIPSLTVPPY